MSIQPAGSAIGAPFGRDLQMQECHALPALALGLGVSLAASADDAKLKSYGRHLAQECTGCHRIDGVDNGIPPSSAGARSGS